MSYYDFSSQRPKQQKSRALLVIGLTLTVIAIAAILFARHHKSRALHEAKIKMTDIALKSELIPLPTEANTAKSIHQVKNDLPAPQLEFYEILKSKTPEKSTGKTSHSDEYRLEIPPE